MSRRSRRKRGNSSTGGKKKSNVQATTTTWISVERAIGFPSYEVRPPPSLARSLVPFFQSSTIPNPRSLHQHRELVPLEVNTETIKQISFSSPLQTSTQARLSPWSHRRETRTKMDCCRHRQQRRWWRRQQRRQKKKEEEQGLLLLAAPEPPFPLRDRLHRKDRPPPTLSLSSWRRRWRPRASKEPAGRPACFLMKKRNSAESMKKFVFAVKRIFRRNRNSFFPRRSNIPRTS